MAETPDPSNAPPRESATPEKGAPKRQTKAEAAEPGAAAAADRTPEHAPQIGSGALGRVPIEIVISVGRSRPSIRDLLRLQRDTVLPLDRRVNDPVELYVGERLIARGMLEELEGEAAGLLGVRLTEVIDMREGL